MNLKRIEWIALGALLLASPAWANPQNPPNEGETSGSESTVKVTDKKGADEKAKAEAKTKADEKAKAEAKAKAEKQSLPANPSPATPPKADPVKPVSDAPAPSAATGETPIDGEALEAEPIDGEALEAEPIDGEALEAEPIDGEALEAEPIDGEALEEAPKPPVPTPVPSSGEDAQKAPPKAAKAAPKMPTNRDDDTLDTITIVGKTGEIARVAGSAHLIGETALEENEYDDVHRVLAQVPGVYVRDEDGYGLRPNIGLRGANSDRSAKVTLMEDGVLLAPAPYAAPAAYYFPLTTRLASVEVFKGPAAIQYGPNTIGGALNMITRSAPGKGAIGQFDAAYGERRGQKLHGYFGQGWANVGYVIEGALIGNDGFKDLDGGGETGFDKSELMLKVRVNNDLLADVHHRLELKLGYSNERSYETYLGLTEEDFAATPYRRYAASQHGSMEWDRTQAKLVYTVLMGEDVELRLTGYRHDFDRSWRKLNNFVASAGVSVAEVLADPTLRRHQRYFGILTGEHDWTGDPAERLAIGTNQRDYVSQGVQLNAEWRSQLSDWLESKLQVGVRLHTDYIERNHTEGEYDMVFGRAVQVIDDEQRTENRGEASAISAHVFEELVLYKRLTLTPGVRAEFMSTGFEDFFRGVDRVENSAQIVLPGLGAWYALNDEWGLLAGVHRGFSPVAPGQDDEVSPEVSTNYEAGVRWQYPRLHGEVIGFYNQYRNLVGTCTQSSGCDLSAIDTQFNAGEATIYGLETGLGGKMRLLGGRLSANVTYTLTVAQFDTDFESGFSQWAQVEEGDALPYVPEHQGALRLSYERAAWGITTSVSHVGEMRDSAGQGDVPEGEGIPARTVVDGAVHVNYRAARVYLTIDNVLDDPYLASRRPYGLRPGKPRQVMIGCRIGL